VGCQGATLTENEKSLFAEMNPAGFILFQRNCISKRQVTDLIAEMRDCVGRKDAPVLIDQEGGSVSRLKEPEWSEYASAKFFADIAYSDLETACKAAFINSQLMALDMVEMGITVNCAPVVDIPSPECHEFLSGSRAYGRDVETVAGLGQAVCEGLLAGGISPVLKHIPGHGRGQVDSHKSLPHVDAPYKELSKIDFVPFREISKKDYGNSIWAMGAHVVYSDIDSDSAATLSSKITNEVIRRDIGFQGLLIADDISMQALDGSLADRAEATLKAGMDLTLHCNGVLGEMTEILPVVPMMTDQALERMNRAEIMRLKKQSVGLKDREHLIKDFQMLVQKQDVA